MLTVRFPNIIMASQPDVPISRVPRASVLYEGSTQKLSLEGEESNAMYYAEEAAAKLQKAGISYSRLEFIFLIGVCDGNE